MVPPRSRGRGGKQEANGGKATDKSAATKGSKGSDAGRASLSVKFTNAARATNKLEETQHELDGTHLFGITETWCGEHNRDG